MELAVIPTSALTKVVTNWCTNQTPKILGLDKCTHANKVIGHPSLKLSPRLSHTRRMAQAATLTSCAIAAALNKISQKLCQQNNTLKVSENTAAQSKVSNSHSSASLKDNTIWVLRKTILWKGSCLSDPKKIKNLSHWCHSTRTNRQRDLQLTLHATHPYLSSKLRN